MASDLLRRNDTENREMLHNKIDEYIDDISQLTADIIQLSRLNNKRCSQISPTSDTFSQAKLCQKRVEMMSVDSTITLNIEPHASSAQVCGSSCFAKLTLDNLIKNAINYGNGIVEVSLAEFESCWTIDVEDNGEGIPKDKREEIFLAHLGWW